MLTDRRCERCDAPVGPRRRRCAVCRVMHNAERHAKNEGRLRLHKVVIPLSMRLRALAARAASQRGLPLREYVRQVVEISAVADLRAVERPESDPFARRVVDSGCYPEPLRSGRKA